MELCLHCEKAAISAEPRHRHLRLCDRCAAVRGLRVIYKRRTRWTPEWDAHLQRLVERAKLRLPSSRTSPMKIHDVDLPDMPDEPAAKPSRSRMRVIELAADEADQARCPRCGVPMVARLGRAGPYFHCRCRPREAARPSILPLAATLLPFPAPALPAQDAAVDAGKKDEAPLVIALGSR